MTQEIPTWHDGDVFFWSYKESAEQRSYHCKSQKAIVRDDRLIDLFWSGVVGNTSWSLEQASQDLTLTFKGNIHDFEQIDDWLAEHYDPQDIINLNHANCSKNNSYRRKGAYKSATVMLALVETEIRNQRYALDRAMCNLAELENHKIAILRGDDINSIYL